MPANELLLAQTVTLTVSLKQIISQHGHRVMCEHCGEDIINEREVRVDGEVLCRACALGAYYSVLGRGTEQHLCWIRESEYRLALA